jgi:hypothetical protein
MLTVAMEEDFSVRTVSSKSSKREDVLQTMVRVNKYFIQKYIYCTQLSNVEKLRPSNIRTRGVYYKGSTLHRIYLYAKYCENGSALTIEQKQVMRNP